jgi:hypothetical protein
MEEEMKYKGTGMYPDKETCELEVTVEMYSSETVWTFDIDDKSDYYSSASIGMSTAEVTRLRDELNLLIEHERKHREFRGNIPVDYAINKQMEKHGIDFFDCPTKDLEDGDIMIPTLQEEVEFTGRRQVTDNVKKLIKERETE